MTPALTPAALAELEAAEKAMTPGPWQWEAQMLSAGKQTIIWPANAQREPKDAVELLGSCGTTAEIIAVAEANRDGIALLRNALPALLATARRCAALERVAEAALEVLANPTGHYDHVDPMGTAGRNCAACHENQKNRSVLTTALAALDAQAKGET